MARHVSELGEVDEQKIPEGKRFYSVQCSFRYDFISVFYSQF